MKSLVSTKKDLLKIIILANADSGLYRFRKELLTELTKCSELSLVLPSGKWTKLLEAIGCHVIPMTIDRRGINPFRDMKLCFRYWQIIRRHRPDLVITYTIKPNIYGGLICRLLGVRYATNITGVGSAFQGDGWLKKMVILFYRVALKKAQCVFFQNQANLELFSLHAITSAAQSVLINGSGVNTADYPLTGYPTDHTRLRFLFIGRIMREKGVGEFLAAARKLKQKYPQIFFEMVGPLEENDPFNAASLEHDSGVVYHGLQKDVRPFIARAHCFILPSYHEGMANSLLESAAMGRPSIASDIPGCREAVIDGKTGYLIQPRSVESLVEKVEQFIHLTPTERKNMGQQASVHIKINFDKHKVNAVILENLDQIVNFSNNRTDC